MRFLFLIPYTFFLLYFHMFHRHRVYGLENIPKGAALIVANHASFFDPPIIGCSIPEEVHYLARRSLFRNPVFGWLISLFNAHPVNQNAHDHTSFRTIIGLVRKGKKVAIFPEGRRSRTGEALPLKPGIGLLAKMCNCPVLPVYIGGSFEALPPGKHFPRLYSPTSCRFGPPLLPEEIEKLHDPRAITAAIEERMLRLRP